MNNTIPLVAVWMITYNHQNFIEKAVNSVLVQETDFYYKIFLSEDKSTDNTRELCVKLADKHSDLIELYLPDKNLGVLGPNGIGLKTYERCFHSGAKYIAMLEGDDYWTDPLKLQKQVDFLESHNEYGSAYHRSIIVNEKGAYLRDKFNGDYRDHDKEDLLIGNGQGITNTLLFRNFHSLPKCFQDVPNGDTFLAYLLGELGHMKFLLDVKPSAYRIHSGGVWSAIGEVKRIKNLVNSYAIMSKHMRERGRPTIFLNQILKKQFNRSLRLSLSAFNLTTYAKLWLLLIKQKNKTLIKGVFQLQTTYLIRSIKNRV